MDKTGSFHLRGGTAPSISDEPASTSLPSPKWRCLPCRHWSNSSPVCARHGSRVRHGRPAFPRRSPSDCVVGPIRSRQSPPSCGNGSRQSPGVHRANCWSGCRLSTPASTRTGSCAHCSVAAHRMVFGTMTADPCIASGDVKGSLLTMVRTTTSAIVMGARKVLWICRCALMSAFKGFGRAFMLPECHRG